MTDDLVQRVIASVQGVVAKSVAEAEQRFESRLQERLSPLEQSAATILDMVKALPIPKDGENGKDATIDYDAIREQLRWIVQTEVSKLPPPEPGKPGEKGADGINPEPAAILEFVRPEIEKEIALAVAAIPLPKNGADAQDGQDGQPGERGEPGRDALELDVLKGISEQRSYARGTWAAFDGSLWVASRQTIPLADKSADNGWRCVVAGIYAMEFSFDLERRNLDIDIGIGGTVLKRSVEIPVLLDRGVYRPDMAARAGDVVSHDGSAWVARAATMEQPGTSKDWRLLVMRGRNGKDAERAARIDQPVRLR